jgi:gamma-D-glutamyl-L-lysine dipeptidyl-peptidase
MSLRAAGAALALLVAAGGVTDALASTGPATKSVVAEPVTGSGTGVMSAAGPHRALRLQSTGPQTVWVAAGVATVWVKPGRTRPVDKPALLVHPDIARWINRQTLRQRLDLGPRVMTQALHGDTLLRLTHRDGWSRVRLPDQTGSRFRDGIVGWVPSRQLTTIQPHRAVLRAGIKPHGNGRDALRIARSYLGIRYLWAGLSRSGIDCSGLTYRVFRSLGVVLPRDAADQSRIGKPVHRRDLHKGDLVFFGTGSWTRIHHVGIYAGHGRVLHAPYTGTTVQVTPLRSWSDYWGARRVR